MSSNINDNPKPDPEFDTKQTLERFKPLLTRRGGIFTKSARKRLLGLSPGRPGWSKSSADFRHDKREYVKQALLDLELFIRTVDDKDINRVINVETIEPLIKAYFRARDIYVKTAEKSIVKADLARVMIYSGMSYLTLTLGSKVPAYERKMLTDAKDVTRRLVNEIALNLIEKKNGGCARAWSSTYTSRTGLVIHPLDKHSSIISVHKSVHPDAPNNWETPAPIKRQKVSSSIALNISLGGSGISGRGIYRLNKM